MRFGEFLRLSFWLLVIALPTAVLVNWSLGSDQPSYASNANQPDCETTKVTIFDQDGAKKTVLLDICGGKNTAKFFYDSISQNSTNNEASQHDSETVNQAISTADLVEQRSMARSTWIIMIATVFGLLVASTGLWLIYKTLGATQDTLKVTQTSLRYAQDSARQAAEATEQVRKQTATRRAYIGLDDIRIERHGKSLNEATICAVVVNSGETPGIDVTVKCIAAKPPQHSHAAGAEPFTLIFDNAGTSTPVTQLGPRQTLASHCSVFDANLTPHTENIYRVAVFAEYNTIFKNCSSSKKEEFLCVCDVAFGNHTHADGRDGFRTVYIYSAKGTRVLNGLSGRDLTEGTILKPE